MYAVGTRHQQEKQRKMGDRGNIYVENCPATADAPSEGVFFYSHWGGVRQPRTLKKAIRDAQGRLTDPAYFGRIVAARQVAEGLVGDEPVIALTGFDVVGFREDNIGAYKVLDDAEPEALRAVVGEFAGTTGYGISTRLCDNEYPVLAVLTGGLIGIAEGEAEVHPTIDNCTVVLTAKDFVEHIGDEWGEVAIADLLVYDVREGVAT